MNQKTPELQRRIDQINHINKRIEVKINRMNDTHRQIETIEEGTPFSETLFLI